MNTNHPTSQAPKSKGNVISIFAAKSSKHIEDDLEEEDIMEAAPKEDLDAATRRFKENEERMRKERLKANKSVLKSHNLKKKN